MHVYFRRDALVGSHVHQVGTAAEVEDAVGHRLVKAGAAALYAADEAGPDVADVEAGTPILSKSVEVASAEPGKRRKVV